MAINNMAEIIMFMYPDAVPMQNFVVRDDADGKGQYIDDWGLPYPIPTDADIQANYLGMLKKQKKTEFNGKCNAEILDGFTSPTTGHFYWFDYKDQDNFTQQMVLMLNDSTISSVQWKTGSGIITHTKDEFISVCKDADSHKRGKMGKYWTLCAQIDACTTQEQVGAIQW